MTVQEDEGGVGGPAQGDEVRGARVEAGAELGEAAGGEAQRIGGATERSDLPPGNLGGLLIGLIETFWSAYFSIDYKDVATFSILAITLIFLPSGLLGKPEVEKV